MEDAHNRGIPHGLRACEVVKGQALVVVTLEAPRIDGHHPEAATADRVAFEGAVDGPSSMVHLVGTLDAMLKDT